MRTLIVGGAFLIGMVLFVLLGELWSRQSSRCVSERELIFYYQPMMESHANAFVRSEGAGDRCGVADAMFHMRSAIKLIGSAEARRVMTERFLSRHSEYSNHIVTVSKAFQGVTTELCAGMPPSVRVRTETSDLGLSREVVECFADAIVGYFKDENHGLFEKMSAWFEGQKAGKGLDEVKKIDDQKRLAIENAKRKSLQVLLSTNGYDAIVGSRWGLAP